MKGFEVGTGDTAHIEDTVIAHMALRYEENEEEMPGGTPGSSLIPGGRLRSPRGVGYPLKQLPIESVFVTLLAEMRQFIDPTHKGRRSG